METKHTPGPWVFIGECEPLGGNSSQRGSAFQVWEDMNDRGRIIAEVVSTEDESIGVTEGIANARLIAAAPELLEACRRLLVLHKYLNEHQTKGQPAPQAGLNDQAFAAMCSARFAIAKATGLHPAHA
jgi:hypothetical protein